MAKSKFNVGDSVHSEKYGNGVCKKVDLADKRMTYLVSYEDGTLIWYDAKAKDLSHI